VEEASPRRRELTPSFRQPDFDLEPEAPRVSAPVCPLRATLEYACDRDPGPWWSVPALLLSPASRGPIRLIWPDIGTVRYLMLAPRGAAAYGEKACLITWETFPKNVRSCLDRATPLAAGLSCGVLSCASALLTICSR